MEDTDPWAATAMPADWTAEARVQFNPADPSKTIPFSWAQDYIQRRYKANPATFGNQLAEVVKDWMSGKYGSEEAKGNGHPGTASE